MQATSELNGDETESLLNDTLSRHSIVEDENDHNIRLSKKTKRHSMSRKKNCCFNWKSMMFNQHIVTQKDLYER